MKKAGLSFVMMLVLVIVSMVIILTVSVKLFNNLELETQNKVCEIDVGFTNSLANSDETFWGFKSLGETRADNPYCKTIVEEIDLTKYKVDSTEFKEKFTIELGERIENCWDTFGNGKYANTFGQSIGVDDKTNYYFPCYKVKFKFKDPNYSFPVSELINMDGDKSGLLWEYDIFGKKIEGDIEDANLNYLEQDKNIINSYAGYVFYGGYGYLEFMENVKSTVSWSPNFGEDGWLAGPLGWITGASLLYRNQIPNSGESLEKIDSDQWYEIRYYSPYIYDSTDTDRVVFNNIKVVPLNSEVDNEYYNEEVEGVLG